MTQVMVLLRVCLLRKTGRWLDWTRRPFCAQFVKQGSVLVCRIPRPFMCRGSVIVLMLLNSELKCVQDVIKSSYNFYTYYLYIFLNLYVVYYECACMFN